MRIATSCFSATHILSPPVPVLPSLCNRIYVQTGWPTAAAFSKKAWELSGSFFFMQQFSFSIIPDLLVLKNTSCLKNSATNNKKNADL